jgi:serine/threonine protein kinase
VLGGVALIIFIVWLQRRLRRRVYHLELEKTMQERLLATQSTELVQLERIWEISDQDVLFKRELGHDIQGTFAKVWYGEWQGREVAIKVLRDSINSLDSTAQEKFKEEMKLIRQLRHKNIVFFYGIGVHSQSPFLVFEWMTRGALEQVLHGPIVLSWKRRVLFAQDTAKGMAYLHNHNPPFLHRDLKSANLLISKDWTLKVGDFGTARHSLHEHWETGSVSDQHSRRYTGAVGTIAWTAPEVLSDEVYGSPCDVYSFGIVCWELCSRKQPYEDIKNHFALKKAVLDGTRPAVPDHCPADFYALINRCV